MSVWDLDNYTDAASDAADAVVDVTTSMLDAGDLIGNILKSIAPALSMVPGFGIALGPAIYAAGAVAAGDRIDDILIGSARNAIPLGPARIAYDGATSITKDVAEGKNAFTSTVNALREAANSSGPQAGAAFDAGLAAGRGETIDPRAIAAGRNFALTSGGQAAAASYDAGVALAKGGDATDVALEVSRNYVRDMGGAEAAAAYDAGIALGYGKTLQEAGFEGLHTFVRGNDFAEKILNFVDRVGSAKNAREAVKLALTSDLSQDLMGALAEGGIPPEISKVLEPYTDLFQTNSDFLNIPAIQLAQDWGVPEIIVRAGQAAAREGLGRLDQELLDYLDEVADRNRELAEQGYAIAMSDPRSVYLRSTGPEGAWKQGFDIGTAVTQGSSQWGPGQAEIRDSVNNDAFRDGFNAARNLQYTLTKWRAQIAAFGTGKEELPRPTASSLQLASALSSSGSGSGGIVSRPSAVLPLVVSLQKDTTSGSLDALLASRTLDLAQRALARQPFLDYYNGLA